MNKDDPTSECCPICKDKECKIHLLARFDASGDEGELGVGLIDGPLCNVNDIEEVLLRTRVAWVRSVRTIGKPEVSQWITKERGLQNYFDALGGLVISDLEKYDSDEDAADDLKVQTDSEVWHAREDFLRDALSSCGWLGETTEGEYDVPLRSTTYLNWWALKPSEIAERFRAELRGLLWELSTR
jgi:hypothetical protein